MIADQEKRYIVYVHIAPNGKRYVGQTSKAPNARWRNGEGYKAHHPHFYAAVQKYGWDAFDHKILAQDLTKQESDAFEAYLISSYKSYDRRYGYNVELAARGPGKHTAETRAKIAASNKGRIVSEETRRKISASLMGNKPAPKSEAGLKAIIKFNTGRHPTEETRKKLSESHRGHVWSEESKEKMRQSLRGRKCEWCRIRVRQIDAATGSQVAVFDCAKDAQRSTGIASANISAVCKGRRQTAGGYKWEYAGGEGHN